MRSPVDTLRGFWHRIKYRVRPPTFPQNPGGEVYLHLGCGTINRPGFINVDARAMSHVHRVMDVCDLRAFPAGYADLIYACHILEHVSFRETRTVLVEWKRVLKPCGILRLSVPDFDRILAIYEASGGDTACVAPILMGDHDYPANSHHALFNYRTLESALKGVGFREVRIWDPATAAHHDFEDWASKSVEFGFGSFPVSLNVEAIN